MQKEFPTTGVLTEEAATVTHVGGEPDDEEGWISEDNGDATITHSSTTPGKRRKHVRSSKGKAVVKISSTGLGEKGRWRLSASEQDCSSPQACSPTSDTTRALSPVTSEPEQVQDINQEVERRGRSIHHERKGSNLSSRPSIHHRRLESLKLAQHSRDASPSRSIRFADEHPSGTSTPRNGALPNES